jgi:hypothetical protein
MHVYTPFIDLRTQAVSEPDPVELGFSHRIADGGLDCNQRLPMRDALESIAGGWYNAAITR